MKKGIRLGLAVGAIALAMSVARVGADPFPMPLAIASVNRPAIPLQALDQRLIGDLLIESIIQIESAGNPRMIGSKGERGLMQIMERTWREVTQRHFGERVPFSRAFDPELNRRVGAVYLTELQAFLLRHRAQWKSDERSLLLACYNAGPERVRQAGFDIRRLPASTRDYVVRGSALHEALLDDHNIPPRAVRLAMDAIRRSGGV